MSSTEPESRRSARELKEEIQNTTATLHPRVSDIPTSRIEKDPDATLIQQLREEGMNWATIAAHLNHGLEESSDIGTWTPTSVYSRFVSSSTSTVRTTNEIGFDTKDYAHLRNPGDGERSRVARKRVKDYNSAKELAGNVRKQVDSEEQYAELQTPEMTEILMRAVAVVDLGFWVAVADEVERRSGKYFAPGELAERFHEV